MSNINLHNVSREEELLRTAYKDLIAFGKLFLPKDFMRSETPFFHYIVADKLLDKTIRQLAVIMSRGHGKTVLTKGSILHDFVFNDKIAKWGLEDGVTTDPDPLFYGWVAASSKISVPNLDYIKYHLEYNDLLKYYFGNLAARGKFKWTEDDIELLNGCKLLSKSNLSGIRGGAKLHKRYDLIVLDDFEDENNTVTPEARSKISNLVTAVVFPSLEPTDGRLRINGTPVHYDSFINNILVGYDLAKKKGEPYSWDVVRFATPMENGQPLWPSWFPLEELERKKKFYADSGQPQKYYQEYCMEVQSEEDAMWTRDNLKYFDGIYKWNEELNIGELVLEGGVVKQGLVFGGGDPATDIDRRESDRSVILSIFVDVDNNVYVIDYMAKRSLDVLGTPGTDREKGFVDILFDKNKIFHHELFVIEDTTMSRPIFQSLPREMRRRNDFTLKVKPEKPGTRQSKRDRIQAELAQRFAIGQIHIKSTQHDLQREILTFGPRMAHDDIIDALAYAVKYSRPPSGTTNKDGNITRKYKPKAKKWTTA